MATRKASWSLLRYISAPISPIPLGANRGAVEMGFSTAIILLAVILALQCPVLA
jgi:hypothetical protein